MPNLNPLKRVIEASLTAAPNSPLPPLDNAASSSSRAAIRRCRAAWKRAYDAYIESQGDDDHSTRYDAAKKHAPAAYRAAMPALDSLNNVRDFIACTAHGILIEAIPQESSGQLLYAAQVALGLLQLEAKSAPKRQNSALPPSPCPLPGKTAVSAPESDVND